MSTPNSLRDVHPTAFHNSHAYMYAPSVSYVTTRELYIENGIFYIDNKRFVVKKVKDCETISDLLSIRNGELYFALCSTYYCLNNVGSRKFCLTGENIYLDYDWPSLEVRKATAFLTLIGSIPRKGQIDYVDSFTEPITGPTNNFQLEFLPVPKSEVPMPIQIPEVDKMDVETYVDPIKAGHYVAQSYEERVAELKLLFAQIPRKAKRKIYILGDGAGTGYRAATMFRHKVVSYDPSPQMVDQAISMKNKVLLGDGKDIKPKGSDIVFVSHVLSIAPGLSEQLSKYTRVIIYERNLFESYTSYQNPCYAIYTKGIDFPITAIIPEPLRRPVSTFDYEVMKPGVIIGIETFPLLDDYCYALYNLRLFPAFSTHIICRTPYFKLAVEILRKWKMPIVGQAPNIIITDSPSMTLLPWLDIKRGYDSRSLIAITESSDHCHYFRVLRPHAIMPVIKAYHVHVYIPFQNNYRKTILKRVGSSIPVSKPSYLYNGRYDILGTSYVTFRYEVSVPKSVDPG